MSQDGIGNNRMIFDRVSVQSVVILFACCAAMLVLLVVFRTIINIIIIDVCILGDCSAWRKLCFCCRRSCRCFGLLGDRNTDDDQNLNIYHTNTRESANDNITAHGWIEAFRRAGLSFAGSNVMDPVSYLYSRPQEQRKAFLESIIDAELLSPHIVVEVRKDSDNNDRLAIAIPKIITSTASIATHKDEKETIQDDERRTPYDHDVKCERISGGKGHENDCENDDDSIDEETETSLSLCSICLQYQKPGEQCCRANTCSHTFHTDCIKSWIERSLLCPVCRRQMISNDALLDCMSKKRNIFVGSTSYSNATATMNTATIDISM